MTSNLALKPEHIPASVNEQALARATAMLPELIAKTAAFDRSNSQTTLALMSLTMLNGHSPMRLLRQILAETEQRRMALAEAQVTHAESLDEIERLEADPVSRVSGAKLRMKRTQLSLLEEKINGAIKDIAALSDAYEAIKTKHGISDDWDEAAFEQSEKRHHVRRGFELLYRNMVQNGRPHEATIEYMQQFGIHVQVALTEVTGYIVLVDQLIQKGQTITSAHLEAFLDAMAAKYLTCADEACERIFGKSDITNPDYMMRTVVA